METKEIFETLMQNLKVGETASMVAARRNAIAKSLNKEFRDLSSSTDNTLMVGSYGRHTAIRGISDLDMLYYLPEKLREDYLSSESGPRKALDRVKAALQKTYSTTNDIRVDRCIVALQFSSNKFRFEIQPVFREKDGSFTYPDTYTKSWKNTKPLEEKATTRECNKHTSNNMRHLARMTRAWRNNVGLAMSGLLVDTLVYNFFQQEKLYNSAGPGKYDEMVRDFFDYLANLPERTRYLALGSNQHVKVKDKFQNKAKKARNICETAIEKEGKEAALTEWRKVFGRALPAKAKGLDKSFTDTEEFIENLYPVDIRESAKIDCKMYNAKLNFRTRFLRSLLANGEKIIPRYSLLFYIKECSISEPYTVKWKVLNRGPIAKIRNSIRGEISNPNKPENARFETADFGGNHLVECYIIKDEVVVARDSIQVPIKV